MLNYLPTIIWFVVLAAVAVYSITKQRKNRSAAQSGEDMGRIKRELQPLLSTEESYQTVYAHREERSSYGRTVKITYHYYAVAFYGDTICISPLRSDKKSGQLQLGKPMVITPENLGKVKLKTKGTDDSPTHMELWLGDKQGHAIIELTIDAENIHRNRYTPMNIMQHTECASFKRFIDALAQRVAAENPGIDDIIKAEDNQSLGFFGACVGVLGIFFGFFSPFLGLGITGVGFILSLVSKLKGAKGIKSLIVSILCVIWSVGFFLFYRKTH